MHQRHQHRADDAGHVQREQHQALQIEHADGCAGMNAPISSAYTGRRAEQVISGAIMMVASRSRMFGNGARRHDAGDGAGEATTAAE